MRINSVTIITFITFITVIAVSVLLLPLFLPVMAADLEVTCISDSGCTPSFSSALFLPSEVWYPGKIINKTVRITNGGEGVQTVATQVQNMTVTGDLNEVIGLAIYRTAIAGVPLWSGTLKNFYDAGEVGLVSLAGGSSDNLVYSVRMDPTAGNIYQGKDTSFDLVLGFTSTAGGGVLGEQENIGGGAATVSGVSTGDWPGWWRYPAAGVAGGGIVFLLWKYLRRK